MKTLYGRFYQLIMKLFNYFVGYRTPEYILGNGAVNKLPDKIKAKGIKKVMIVTDSGLMKLGLPDMLTHAMETAGLDYVIFSNIQPNPTDENIYEGYNLFKENACEAIIALGGGSSMDCAKGIMAKNARPGKTIPQLQGVLKVRKKTVTFYAIPTTAGTGSETTLAAVITETATRHKASINDPAIMPNVAVLDPQLTLGLPPHITSTTGLDALCHAVESYINWTYLTPLEKDYSKKAVRLIYDNLYKAYIDGSNVEARQNMQLAAFYAGRSFTRGCVGNIHAVGHTLGGLYGIPHGLAMSVIMPRVLRMYEGKADKRLSELADVCGFTGSRKEKAESFISWIEEMSQKMDIPKGFDCIEEKDIPQIIQWADKEANPLYPVPVIWGEKEFRRLIESIRIAR